MFKFFKSEPDNTDASVQIAPQEAPAPEPDIQSLHWRPTGLFPVVAAGTSNYRAELEQIAQNPAGKAALVFCTAVLLPEDDNPHDANAVRIEIEGKKVGYLSKEYAPTFRHFFEKFGVKARDTSCDAVICNGQILDGKCYSYGIELDIAKKPELPVLTNLAYPRPVRKDPTAVFSKQGVEYCLVHVRLNAAAYENMTTHGETHSWTTDHWTTINYYVLNSYGIGLGEKLFEVPKDRHREMFGDKEPELTLVSLNKRDAVFSLRTPS